mmetsp:Transcript_105258/g.241317  ORF Transcript_105258/g.241317 Transcript_105258/m.241317 type:complete len:150 (+) Transcript_105258:50-499(+)
MVAMVAALNVDHAHPRRPAAGQSKAATRKQMLVSLARENPDKFESVFPELVGQDRFLSLLPENHPFRARRMQQEILRAKAEFTQTAAELGASVDALVRARGLQARKALTELHGEAQAGQVKWSAGETPVVQPLFQLEQGLFSHVASFYA